LSAADFLGYCSEPDIFILTVAMFPRLNKMDIKASLDRIARKSGYWFFPLLVLFAFRPVIAVQPRPGSLVVAGEFETGVVWDGLALQEKELARSLEFGIIVDSAGNQVYNGDLKYRHGEFGPSADIAVYVFPRLAIGAGYGYGWVDQFVNVNHRLKNNPGGSRLCSSHMVRGRFVGSIIISNTDEIDLVGIPFYIFGSVTRVPLPLEIYKDIADAQAMTFLKEIHKPIDFKGYGFEMMVCGRHFLNKYIFIHGSIYSRVKKIRTGKDLFEHLLCNAPQGSFGLKLGLGFMLRGNDLEVEHPVD